jgi:hypothetical protein
MLVNRVSKQRYMPLALVIMRILFLAMIGIALLPAPTMAQTPVINVNPAIETIVSGGRWQAGKSQGHFRVIIVRQGWEEIRRLARVEWIREPSERGPEVVVKQLDLTDRANVYALAEPVIEHKGDEWFVRFKAASAPLAAYDLTVALGLGTPGMATLIQRP